MKKGDNKQMTYMNTHNTNIALTTFPDSNVKIYTAASVKNKDNDKADKILKEKLKETETEANSQLQEIKHLIKSFDYAINKYSQFKNAIVDIDQTKKRAEREMNIHYQYKESKMLTDKEDGIVCDYKIIFDKVKTLQDKQ